ncbi:hypothetical protein BC827DRAFT_1263072 [Russula dissimulans]|nr:hypothetical protein BC827DRAFT_1263072 [Russula dissimulans]
MQAEKEIFFYAPDLEVPPAPPPESFNEELNDLDLSDWLVGQFCFEEISSSLPLGDFRPIDTTPSLFMYSTDSGRDIAPSQYSSSNDFMSDYSVNAPSSQVTQEYHITPEPDFNSPVIVSEPPQLTGSFPSTPLNFSISDPSDFFFCVSDYGGELSNAIDQSPIPDISENDPVYVTPDDLTHSGPARADSKGKVFKCPYCPLSSARKHNLKTHIATHKKLKPYMCNICKRCFGRKHDVRRHIEVKHEDHRSWLSTHLDTLIISVSTNGAPTDDMVDHAQMPGA